MATSTSLPSAAAAPRSSKLMIGLLVATSLAALAGGGYALSRNGLFAQEAPAAASPKPAPKPAPKPIFVTLEPLTVNVQSEGRSRFLHIGMALKVNDELAKAQLVEFMPELRSRLLLLLSNRQPETLLSTQDKAKLAEEIRAELNRPLSAGAPPQAIASVSFNTFVVQ
ncbi:flagellar basal body-associated protein FliL [Variovorax guangxiensis]|uniref:flagellar basal body-associated protein FliL n=1 Tax=Variovorax guangxiensis TaxID=1775474 RepID=UPI002865A591|nr:flagellar basal body-associated protein FliL [Variovorax guangxiensis]MDR6860016.1 flagellar FliL protein [Variovorax guangxiensis]